MADRKVELEKKRKKLEELRKARELKKKEAVDKEVPASKSPVPSEREDVNKLVSDLIGGTLSPFSSHSPQKGNSKSPEPVPGVAEELDTGKATPPFPRKRHVKLVMDHLAPINIRPKEVEVYAKMTQTDPLQENMSDNEEEPELPSESAKLGTQVSEKPPQDTDTERPAPKFSHLEFSGEQVDKIMATEDFSIFIDRASRLMERALCDPDILFDHILGEGEDDGEGITSMTVAKKRAFFDNRWSQNRIVTSMDWSGHHPELLLVSYFTNQNIPHDPDGVALIWDLKFQKDTPDYIFNCQSAVMSVAYSKFHPSYIIGGTYSGQLVLWDTRSGKRTPVQRSPLSSSAHTHPVYCLDVVGSQNAHNLISASSDGRLCSWNLDMLSQPQECLDLQNKQTRPVAVTCLSFPTNDVNKFVVGSEECTVYQGQRHGTKPGVAVQFDGHSGPLSNISTHQAVGGQVDLSHLFLTSSFDWTIKLWSTKLQNEQELTSKTGHPLCSFENNNEYVYDVQWSPIHPALFASVDGEGRLDFWNINVDTEVPLLTEQLDVALSKLRWCSTGNLLACGDTEGRVHIFEAGEGLYAPHTEDWVKVQQTLFELQENQE